MVSQGILTSICLIFTVDPIGFGIIATFKHRPHGLSWSLCYGADVQDDLLFSQTTVIT